MSRLQAIGRSRGRLTNAHCLEDFRGAVGLVHCVTVLANDRCDRAMMRFDTSFFNSTMLVEHREKGGCHELGHTLGLIHAEIIMGAPEPSCMRQGNVSVYPLPSQHDLNHMFNGYS